MTCAVSPYQWQQLTGKIIAMHIIPAAVHSSTVSPAVTPVSIHLLNASLSESGSNITNQAHDSAPMFSRVSTQQVLPQIARGKTLISGVTEHVWPASLHATSLASAPHPEQEKSSFKQWLKHQQELHFGYNRDICWVVGCAADIGTWWQQNISTIGIGYSAAGATMVTPPAPSWLDLVVGQVDDESAERMTSRMILTTLFRETTCAHVGFVFPVADQSASSMLTLPTVAMTLQKALDDEHYWTLQCSMIHANPSLLGHMASKSNKSNVKTSKHAISPREPPRYFLIQIRNTFQAPVLARQQFASAFAHPMFHPSLNIIKSILTSGIAIVNRRYVHQYQHLRSAEDTSTTADYSRRGSPLHGYQSGKHRGPPEDTSRRSNQGGSHFRHDYYHATSTSYRHGNNTRVGVLTNSQLETIAINWMSFFDKTFETAQIQNTLSKACPTDAECYALLREWCLSDKAIVGVEQASPTTMVAPSLSVTSPANTASTVEPPKCVFDSATLLHRAQTRTRRIVGLLPRSFRPTNLVDIGCGEGSITSELGLSLRLLPEEIHGCDVRMLPEQHAFHYHCLSLPLADASEVAIPVEKEVILEKESNTNNEQKNHQLPFASSSISLVTALMVLHHVQNVEAMIAEIWRITQPGGHVVIREHDCQSIPLALALDVMHGCYSLVWSEPMEDKHFLETFHAHYRTRMQWQNMMEHAGFVCRTASTPIEQGNNNYHRSYYDLFYKPLV